MSCRKKGPINLDTSDIMPKQAPQPAPEPIVQKEETKAAPKVEEEKKEIKALPLKNVPSEQPQQLSTNRIASKIDPAKFNKIQYSGKRSDLSLLAPDPATLAKNEESKAADSEESESVYETESSQQPSNFVKAFHK